MSYNAFHRTWWIKNRDWPNGREPGAGTKHYIAKGVSSESLAQDLCRDWNSQHNPGELSDKAEYEEI